MRYGGRPRDIWERKLRIALASGKGNAIAGRMLSRGHHSPLQIKGRRFTSLLVLVAVFSASGVLAWSTSSVDLCLWDDT